MRKNKQLNKLKLFREMQCQQSRQELMEQQGKLQREEMLLERLEEYQSQYAWSKERRADGLLLNSAHMMAQSVNHAVRHQEQQVGIQQAVCRTAQSTYIEQKTDLRTAEVMLESHQKILDRKEARQEQKLADEMSGRMLFYS